MSDSLTVSSTLSEISTALHEYSSASNWWDTDTISDELLGSPDGRSTDSSDWLGTKRRKLNDFDESGYPLYPWVSVPKTVHPLENEEVPVDCFILHDYEDLNEYEKPEYYNPCTEASFHPYFRSSDHTEQRQYGLQVDKVSDFKRLKYPKRWSVLLLSEVTVHDVPLAVADEEGYCVAQEVGHVAWSKATFFVDKEKYTTKTVTV